MVTYPFENYEKSSARLAMHRRPPTTFLVSSLVVRLVIDALELPFTLCSLTGIFYIRVVVQHCCGSDLVQKSSTIS